MIKKLINKVKNDKEFRFEILVILLIILFSVSISPKTLQNDTYYTVKIGELILNNGIDMQDHFSWHELPYTYPHWLYDVGMFLIYNIGGWLGIYISTCVLSSILVISVYKVNKKLNKNQLISFFITIGSMYMLKSYIAARAQLVTFILFVIFIYFIEKFLENKKIKYAVGMVIISLIIANIHVATWPFIFVLFMPYIAEWIISIVRDWIIYRKVSSLYYKSKINSIEKQENISDKLKERLKKYNKKLTEIEIKNEKIKEEREKEEKYKIIITKNPNVKWIIIVMIICALAGFLTPLGDTPFTYLYKTMQGNTTQNINEHLPLTLIKSTPIMCAIIIYIAVLTFTKCKIRLSDLFMISGLCYLMFSSKRQSTMFVLIGGIILNRLIVQLFEIYGICKIKDLTKNVINKFTAFVITAVIIIISMQYINDLLDDEYVNESSYPVKASEWILKNLDVSQIKLFNEYNFGSYLLYKDIPVFIDSRADLYTPEFNGDNEKNIFSDFLNADNTGTYYGNIFKKYEVTHIIVYKGSKINMFIKNADSEKYELLYSDDDFVVYKILNY